MNGKPENDKSGERPGPAGPEPQPRSGEGADTALQALIRKRRLRGDDDVPMTDPGDPSLSPAP